MYQYVPAIHFEAKLRTQLKIGAISPKEIKPWFHVSCYIVEKEQIIADNVNVFFHNKLSLFMQWAYTQAIASFTSNSDNYSC